jgi:hypothetical protein
MNVITPKGTAKQVLFLLLQTQHPNKAVNKVNRPTTKTGKAYPDWLMLTSSPKVLASGGTTWPVWRTPSTITPTLRRNMTTEMKAMYELQHFR